MEDTATPETGPVDAPVSGDSVDSILAELEAGNEAPADDLDGITQELVNEAEGDGGEPSDEEPATEDDATDPVEEAQEADETAPDEEATYTVKVNGEELQVPLAELLNGYSRTTDYKQKTTEVAEMRRDLEAKATTIEADIKAHYASQLEQATNAFEQFDPVLMEARTINWEQLKATDPAAYVQWQDTVNVRLQQIDQMKQQAATARQESQQQQQAQEQQERAQRFDQTAEKIVSEMPELADEAKFQAFASDAIAHLKNEGFEPDEIASSLDHRVLKLADKARRWDAYQAAQKSLPQKKIVQKSAVKPLTTDGVGSRAPKSRLPANASRDSKVDWVTQQLLSEI
jgi:hypothetical protein